VRNLCRVLDLNGGEYAERRGRLSTKPLAFFGVKFKPAAAEVWPPTPADKGVQRQGGRSSEGPPGHADERPSDIGHAGFR